jgi:tRNA nucleotidyltransferase (CCA-adding enzyme)
MDMLIDVYNSIIEARMPTCIRNVLTRLEDSGYEAYAVGGCIRDCLLSIVPTDWDICTSAQPEQIMGCFTDYRVIPTGLKHGTVTVVAPDEDRYREAESREAQSPNVQTNEIRGAVRDIYREVEVTTYRVDGDYSDNRRPDSVRFVSDSRDDLKRRDFTVNAMAYSLDKGFVDFFGGVGDLKNRLIRCVGDPDKRFNEDGLRILRAMRFSSVYGFDIEEDTDRAAHENRELLKNISAERIASELDMIILGDGAKFVLKKYADAIMVILPEIGPMIGFDQNNIYHVYDVWEHSLVCLDNSPKQLDIRLAMLLHDIEKPTCYSNDGDMGHFYGHARKSSVVAGEILKRLKYDNRTIQNVTALVLHHDDKFVYDKTHIKRMLNKYGAEMLDKLISVKRADALGKNLKLNGSKVVEIDRYKELVDEVLSEKQCFCLKELAIDGSDLIAAGIPESRKIGEILNMLLSMVIEDKLKNNRDELLAAIPRDHTP